MVILAMIALVGGTLYGLMGFENSIVAFLSNHTNYILYGLMFFVGISVGMYDGILEKIKEHHIKVFFIPFGIIVGSLLGGMICSVLTQYSLRESVAVTSGLGWYSLAGVTIGNLAGAELGSIAFLSNLMREILSFFLIPVLSVYCNYYTCIAPAAATSEDTTLPMLIKYTNEETVVLAVLNGMICSSCVPILIAFCYAV